MQILDFKISEFKSYIFSKAEELLAKHGFKLVKKDSAFKKKVNSSKIEIAFDFLDYCPNSYDYNFSMLIWQKEIEQATQEFISYSGLSENVKWSTVLFEADFIPQKKNEEFKFRSSYYNQVKSREELENSVTDSIKIIENDVLPLGYSLCSLDGFQDYYLGQKEEIVKNLASNSLFVSSLLAAGLKSMSDFEMLAEYLKNQLDFQKSQGKNYSELYMYLEKLGSFHLHRNSH